MPKEMKVLYVDDEDINLFLFRSTFYQKFEVHTASGGEEALEVLDNEPNVKWVISDMKMPKMNGLEFIKIARERHSGIKFYLLSGFQKSDEIENALSEQLICCYFTKPFQSDVVLNELMGSSTPD